MADPRSVTLLHNETASGAFISWPGGSGQFILSCSGFNGATIRLEALGPDGVRGVPVDPSGTTNVTFTGEGSGGFTLAAGTMIRAGISGATPSAGAYARADKI